MLEVKDLQVEFDSPHGKIQAVNGVSFGVEKGETVAVVGESGSGKSVTMLAMLKLLRGGSSRIRGSALFDGEDLLQISEARLQQLRGGKIGYIFQDPGSSLNPVMQIGRQIGESMELHLGVSKNVATRKSLALMERVGIAPTQKHLKSYPHQFSGGMRQRVMTAIALACSPTMLIADEPTTALDVTIQAQIVDLIMSLQKESGMSVVWITHDLGVVARLANRVVVMYAGRVVEEGPVLELFENPRHPYTIGLLRSVFGGGATSRRLWSIGGSAPNPSTLPPGCAFAARCSLRREDCTKEVPKMDRVGENHFAACIVNVECLHADLILQRATRGS